MVVKRVNILWLMALVLCTVSCVKEQAIAIIPDFEIEVVDQDFTVPVQILLENKTQGAEQYQWVFKGGSPSVSTQRNPGRIIYESLGNFKITLIASNKDGVEEILEKSINLEDPITIGFNLQSKVNDYPPVVLQIENTTTGANNYAWTFDGGLPKSSTEKNPVDITYAEPGVYTIDLATENETTSAQKSKEFTVLPFLETNFEMLFDEDDDDRETPVSITFTNTSISATEWTWSFPGGKPSESKDSIVTVVYEESGLHKASLTATNKKQTLEKEESFTLLEDTNIRKLTDIKLGVNTAHHNQEIGAFIDLETRRVLHAGELTTENSADVDLVFLGLNEDFTFNQFLSPSNLSTSPFSELLGAGHTRFVNVQENCGCNLSWSVSDFETLENDAILQTLDFNNINKGDIPFSSELASRIVLFETSLGKKGLIKIKEYITEGLNSYILVDIIVQKRARSANGLLL